MSPSDPRRQAASIAAYLAQFELADQTGKPAVEDDPGYADHPDSARDRRRDYRRAVQWAQASTLVKDDLRALEEVRRRYGFP